MGSTDPTPVWRRAASTVAYHARIWAAMLSLYVIVLATLFVVVDATKNGHGWAVIAVCLAGLYLYDYCTREEDQP